MSRQSQLILLCEDSQQETFVRRFLEKAGWSVRRLRVVKAPKGQGSGEQFVRERFPGELLAYRRNRNRVAQGLIVVQDGDSRGVAGRMKELVNACGEAGLEPLKDDEAVVIVIPTWNIETWLAYLDGSEVDETRSNYPRLNRPRDCMVHVDKLHEMCQRQALRPPAPRSLDAACVEYRRLSQP